MEQVKSKDGEKDNEKKIAKIERKKKNERERKL